MGAAPSRSPRAVTSAAPKVRDRKARSLQGPPLRHRDRGIPDDGEREGSQGRAPADGHGPARARAGRVRRARLTTQRERPTQLDDLGDIPQNKGSPHCPTHKGNPHVFTSTCSRAPGAHGSEGPPGPDPERSSRRRGGWLRRRRRRHRTRDPWLRSASRSHQRAGDARIATRLDHDPWLHVRCGRAAVRGPGAVEAPADPSRSGRVRTRRHLGGPDGRCGTRTARLLRPVGHLQGLRRRRQRLPRATGSTSRPRCWASCC